MKKKNLFLIIVLLIITLNSFSQVNELTFNLQPFNSTLAPREGISPMSLKLYNNYQNGGPTYWGTIMEIYGQAGHLTSQLYFGGWDNSKIRYRQSFYNDSVWGRWITMLDSKNDLESEGNLKVTGTDVNYFLNSNVGIGTSTPENVDNWNRVLEVKGNSHSKILSSSSNVTSGMFSHDTGFYSSPAGGIIGTTSNHPFSIITNKINRVVVKNDGNVGIGSSNPDEKLTVKGKIHAEEVKIDLAVPADYVFQKYYSGKSSLKADYTMPTLEDVAAYTKANNHLPSIPSFAEIQKNGLQLGEISNLLLQKIEELTLYAIEQKKEIEELKAQFTTLINRKQ